MSQAPVPVTVSADARALLCAATQHAAAAGLRVVDSNGCGNVTSFSCDRDGKHLTVLLDCGGQEFSEGRMQAECGLAGVHGRSAGRPEYINLPYVSALAGTLAAIGAAAGTLALAEGGAVAKVRTSVRRAALLSVGQYLAAATADDGAERIIPSSATARRRPPFTTSDDVVFEAEILTPEVWVAFWTALDAPLGAVTASWPSYLLRYARAWSDIDEGLLRAARRRTFAEISAAATACGASVCRVRGLGECRTDSGMRFDDPTFSPWLLTMSSQTDSPGHAARVGPLPLAGLRVVESTRRMQGPFASLLLQMLGAEVIRIEPPGGDALRWMGPMAGTTAARFVALNHGKSVVEIDLKSAAGHAAMLAAVRDADVFLHNWAPGRAALLGLDAAHMHSVNPRLVYAYASGWGDLFGAQTPPLGTDFMVQAYSGVAAALSVGRPAPSLMTLLDMYGGAISACGILTGLLKSRVAGCGVRVDTSLISTATALLRLSDGWERDLVPDPEPVEDLSTLPMRYPADFYRPGCAVVASPWSFD